MTETTEPTNTTPADVNVVPQFTDTTGNTWFPRLSYAKLKAIRDETGLDFGNVERMGKTWAELLRNDDTALAVLWISTHADASPGVEPSDEWLAAMDGPALESGINSFLDALYLFTRPLRRELLTAGAKAVQDAYREAIADAQTSVREAVAQSIQAAKRSTPGKPAPVARG